MYKRVLSMAGIIAMAGSAVFAQSLQMIPPVGSDTTSSGRVAIWTGTNAIAFGQSGTSTGLVYDGTSRWVLSADNAGSTVITGAGYRTVAPGVTQLVAHGMTTSGHAIFSSMDNGVTWGNKVRLTNTFQPFTISTANTLAANGTDDKAYFGFPWGASSSRQLEMVTASGGAAPAYLPTLGPVQAGTTSDEGSVRGVAYTSSLANSPAVGVGKRGANAYYVTSVGGKGTLNTLNGTAGEAWAIAKDGTAVFGYSTVTDGRTGLYPWMSTGGIPGTAVELPGLPGAINNANNGVPYGASENGDYAVGMSYPGMEMAVVWDTVNMQVADLNAVFTSLGLMDGFTRLSRAYSVVDTGSGLAIAGQGAWSDGTNTFTRGFLAIAPYNMNGMWVPEPTTVLLLLGGLPLLRRRQRVA